MNNRESLSVSQYFFATPQYLYREVTPSTTDQPGKPYIYRDSRYSLYGETIEVTPSTAKQVVKVTPSTTDKVGRTSIYRAPLYIHVRI